MFPLLQHLKSRASSARSGRPRNLQQLLENIRCPSDVERIVWAKSFRQYLAQSEREEVRDMFDFVVAATLLQVEAEKRAQGDVTTTREYIQEMYTDHFSPDALRPIALSNQELQKELSQALRKSLGGGGDMATEEELQDLLDEAKFDHNVWKGGVARAYSKYLSTNPSLSALSAVLLSII